MKNHMRDFAKDKTVFTEHLDRMRALEIERVRRAVEPKGKVSKFFHWLAKRPAYLIGA